MVLPAAEGGALALNAGYPIRLRACYAMSGTHIAYERCYPLAPERINAAAICQRSLYAVSSTDKVVASIGLRARFSMSGTDQEYGATRQGQMVDLKVEYKKGGTTVQLRYLPTQVLCYPRY
eukprot:1795533-Rhodomonas_salina.3